MKRLLLCLAMGASGAAVSTASGAPGDECVLIVPQEMTRVDLIAGGDASVIFAGHAMEIALIETDAHGRVYLGAVYAGVDAPLLPSGRGEHPSLATPARLVLEAWGRDQESSLITLIVEPQPAELGGYRVEATQFVHGSAITREFETDGLGTVVGQKGCHCPDVAGEHICEKKDCDDDTPRLCSSRKKQYCKWFEVYTPPAMP